MNNTADSNEVSNVNVPRNGGNALEVRAAFPPLGADDYGMNSGAPDTIPLRNYWRSVRKRLWLVMGIAMLVTSLTMVYVARQPDIYQAQARVQVDLENVSSLSGSKNTPVVVNNSMSDVTYFNTQLENLSSSGLLRRVVKTLDLEHNSNFIKSKSGQTNWWRNLPRIFGFGKEQKEIIRSGAEELETATKVAPPTSQDDLEEAMRLEPYVKAIQENLTVKQVNATRLITLTYNHHDPVTAAKVVNALTEAFVLSNLERKTETNTSTSEFLQRRIAELQSHIRTGEEQLLSYAKSNQILTLDENQNTVVERLVGLNRQLLEAENDRKLAESAYWAAQSPGAAGAIAEADTRQVGDIQPRLMELRQKRAELLVENTEKWPAVREVDKQIESLETQAKGIRERATAVVLTNLKTKYEQSLAHEQAIRTAFNQQRGDTLTQNQAAINYRIIQQEIATNKNLLDGLLQRSKENDVDVAGTPNNLHINEHAIIPLVPVGPRRLLTIVLALVVSLIFESSLRSYWNTSTTVCVRPKTWKGCSVYQPSR